MKCTEVKKIWIEAEEWCDGFSVDDENSDVKVLMTDGTKWLATFFTINNVNRLMNKLYNNEEDRHFWSSDMVIVPSFGRQEVECVVERLIEEENFTNAFTQSHE